MNIFIGLMTPDRRLADYFGTNRDASVPTDALKKGIYRGQMPRLTSKACSTSINSCDEAEKFVLGNVKRADLCILIVDVRWLWLVERITSGVFIYQINTDELTNQIQNFLHSKIAAALKIVGHLAAKFSDTNDAVLLRLPIRNFKAAEMQNICQACCSSHINKDFSSAIEQQVALLRKRVRPRRQSSYKNKYAVDDKQRFFKFGNEKHARFETGGEHLPACEVNGLFRFGVALEPDRHYNVSETEEDDTSISGQFADCHGVVHTIAATPLRTHLNMFPNDNF